MRINLYGEELTTEAQLVKKVVEGKDTFIGIRFFLRSPDALHHSTDDDDRSAVTFWAKWTKATGNDTDLLETMLENALRVLRHEV